MDGRAVGSLRCRLSSLPCSKSTSWLLKSHATSIIRATINPVATSPLRSSFHSTAHLHAPEELPDHYSALELPVTASGKDIKRQFYALSKRHHPDLNGGDPGAAKRFVRISEAYRVLSVKNLRARYDRNFARYRPASFAGSAGYGFGDKAGGRHGSFSSAAAHSGSGSAGGRPASGLSKRRTQFRGPPPSFYSAGEWGAQRAKRAAYAPGAGRSGNAAGAGAAGSVHGDYGNSGNGFAHSSNFAFGTGPNGLNGGGYTSKNYIDPDLMHWDRDGHFRTQHGVEQHLRRGSQSGNGIEHDRSPSSLLKFILVSSILFLIGMPVFIAEREKASIEKDK